MILPRSGNKPSDKQRNGPCTHQEPLATGLVTARPQSAHAHRCRAIVVDALARSDLHTSARTWRGEGDLAGSVRRALPGSESHAGTRHWITCICEGERHLPAPADAARIGSDA